ncbi:MAG: hypothetical protein RLZZ517_696 [Candidatus Parcubacteria bacterium]|jgi:mRNA interferase MazF
MKDFDNWNEIKKESETNTQFKFFKPRQIWWIRLGCNIGHEQDGKGKYFERPVLVIRKFNNRIFFGVPLTTKIKDNKFYVQIIDEQGTTRCGIISQLRLFDVSRLREKICFIDKKSFEEIKKAIRRLI